MARRPIIPGASRSGGPLFSGPTGAALPGSGDAGFAISADIGGRFDPVILNEPQIALPQATGPAPGGFAGGFFEAEIDRLGLLGDFLASPPDPRKPSAPQVVAERAEAQSAFRSISVVDQYVSAAAAGIIGLRETLRRPTGAEEDGEDTLFRALETYLDDHMTGEAVNAVFAARAGELATFFRDDVSLGDDGRPRVLIDFDDAELDRLRGAPASRAADAPEIEPQQALHVNLFAAGRAMMGDARAVQRLRHGLVRLRRVRERELKRRRETAAELRAEIARKRRALASLDGARREALGDAQAAQGLAAENWAETEAAYAARREALERNRGLAYVRVRETPVAVPLADPLPLRPDTGGRFPWAGRIEGDLPDTLGRFFDVVLEIPASDWAALRDRTGALPASGKLDALARRRTARLDALTGAPEIARPTIAERRLGPLKVSADAALAAFAARRIGPAGSLKGEQREAASALSLVDLANDGPQALRRDARALRDALEQAILGMLGLLRRVSPGARLAWGEAAEADALALREPARWPALETESARNFNTLRSLFEVVEWWFDQLAPRPAPASGAAMATMLRAALMLAADDDPTEILQGVVRAPPGRLDLGAMVRLTLNRAARPGAMLHLIDPSNVVVGMLRVEDEDAQGAAASVTQVTAQSATVDTRYTVVERRLSVWD